MTKIQNLVKNKKFGQKPKFWSNKTNFAEKSKFWPKIEIFFKNPNFDQKSNFFSKIQISFKNGNFVLQFLFSGRTFNFRQKFKFRVSSTFSVHRPNSFDLCSTSLPRTIYFGWLISTFCLILLLEKRSNWCVPEISGETFGEFFWRRVTVTRRLNPPEI